MVNFENGVVPINDINLNKMQTDLQQEISEMQNNIEIVVENTLESESTTNALSANQGKILNEKINNINTYSTEEINTGKTWINGKPMYRKIVSFIVSNKSISLSNLDFEDGIIEWSRMRIGNYIDILPYISGNIKYGWLQIYRTSSLEWKLGISTNDNDISNFLVEACLLYTKTTD